MESAVVIATGRGGSLQMPSSSSAAAASISSFAQSARKEWRTVSDHHSELERTNLGQSDERTIYEQGAESLHVDFCSITVDGNLDNDILQQRLHNVCRQREDLQHLEVELRAQFIARSGIMQMQNSFDAQIKDHANATEHLKEQLQEKEHIIHELEIKMEEKNRELHAVKIDNETAWAKEDLLMEQNNELANFRRELDNSQAERVHHRNQIHELEEYIQEKERQILELKEQHRVAQETILYKDEQLREAQAWVAHAQEMDALQLSTNHSLQTELRDRTEQFNQFWLGYQRQFVDIERHHLQAIQQLQLQLAEARERGGMLTEQSHTAHAHSEDVSPFGQNKGNLFNNADGMLNDNSGVLTNGDGGNVSALVSTENASSETDHLSGVPLGPPSLLGVGTYLPPGQMTTMHHFVMHPQGVVHNVPSANLHVPQSNMDNFQPVPAISSHQHRQSHQQAVSEDSQESNQIQYRSAPAQELLRSGAHRDHELALNEQVLYSRDYPNSHVTPGQEVAMVAPQVLESKDNRCLISQHADQIIQGTASKFDSGLGLGSLGHCSETKGRDEQMVTVNNHLQERQSLATEQPPAANRVALSDASMDQAITREAIDRNDRDKLTEASILLGSTSNLLAPDKTPEPSLLDERSLLVCIVRGIPAGSGGRVRISSTLPNRLGKMLAPLHWHDYKKKYGKLDDFVANHPELFVIEGDYIQLREGAQEIISATAAVAKVAAAASVPYSSSFPSVAVTPMAQTHRLKKVPSNDSKPVAGDASGPAVSTHADTGGKSSQPSLLKNQHSNDVCYDIVQGLSNVKILSKSKDPLQLNGLQPGIRSGDSSMHMAVGNGVVSGLSTSLSKGSINGKYGTNSGGKPQERVAGANLISRR